MISFAETVAEVGAPPLRDPHPGEPCRMSFDHQANTFTWKSMETGESLRLPPIVEVIMNLRGMKQEI